MTKTVKVPSLNEGRNEVPNVVASTIVASVAIAAAPSTQPRNPSAHSSVGL